MKRGDFVWKGLMNDNNICMNCKHFYITWDASYPYGCRGFGMKSKQCPSLIVFQSSGKPCMVYEAKTDRKKSA